jgi:phosphoribosylglycinamide formyltransferase-1
LDSGPIIAQATVPVRADDTPQTLAARVLEAEHVLYPAALRMIAEGRVRLANGRVVFSDLASADGILLNPPTPTPPHGD